MHDWQAYTNWSDLFLHSIGSYAMLKYILNKKIVLREVVEAQLVEQLFPIPKVCGLTPVISKIYIEHLLTSYYQLYWKDENK